MAITTENDIVNLALAHLHEAALADYTDVTDTTPPAVAARLSFDMVRDMVLREHDWGFALHSAELVASADDADADWSYKYDFPTGALRVVRLRNDNTRKAADLEFTTRHSTDSGVEVIVTDQAEAVAEFIYQETDVTKWLTDKNFVEALVFRLAAYLAGPVTGSSAIRAEMLQLFGQTVNQAKQLDSSEQRVDVADNPNQAYVDARL